MRDRNGFGNDAFCKLLFRGDSLTDGSPSARAVDNNNGGVTFGAATGAGLPSGITKSLTFNGTNQYLAFAQSNDFAFPGDLTIDLWEYTTNTSNNGGISTWNASIGWYIQFNNGKIKFLDVANSVTITTSTYVPSSAWNHIAIIRDSGAFKVAINGVFDVNTASGSATMNCHTLALGLVYSNYFSGQMANIRISRGIARWKHNFTPPTRYY